MAGNEFLYWDSCVFIAWMKNEDRPTGEIYGIRDIVERAKAREVSIITSALTYAEVTEAKVGAGVMNMFDDLFKRRNMLRPAVDMRVARLARDLRGLCLESGGNWFWRVSERVEFCGGQAARSRVSSAIS